MVWIKRTGIKIVYFGKMKTYQTGIWELFTTDYSDLHRLSTDKICETMIHSFGQNVLGSRKFIIWR